MKHFILGHRVILGTLLILFLLTSGVYAYVALTGHVEVTVSEALSFVGDSDFSLQLYPQEQQTMQVTVANASSVDMEVDINYTVTPSGHITVSVPNKITAPAHGQISFDIAVSASKSVAPGVYSIDYAIAR